MLLLALGVQLSTCVGQILPPLPKQTNAVPQNAGGLRLFVRSYRFEGNTAFSDAVLAQVTAPYANRELGSDELEQARRAVTLFYVNHGYVNSGATIPDQKPTDGIVYLCITEGVLSKIELHGNHWLRDGYITSRVERWAKPPLNLNHLQEGLQLLRQNPNVNQVNAELKPGDAPGQSVLSLRVADEQPFRVGFQADNQRPPSVGSSEIWFLASDLNLTGHSDPLQLRYGIANSGPHGLEFSGIDNMEGSYFVPVTAYNTTLGVHASRLNTSLVEDTFRPLNVNSITTTYGVVLRQPVYQTANQEAALAIGFDRRVNTTTLLDEPFNISPGAIDGEMKVSVLRLSQEWVQRGQSRLIALRSTFNIGLDAFGVTDNGVPGDPNAHFFSWLGQGQYIQRLFNTQNQLVTRVSGQWTPDPLLALEQFAVGGLETVRGYRENTLVRDRAIVASVEFRLPVLFDKTGAGMVFLAPFYDFGGGWNVNGSTSPTTIDSTGIGIIINPNKHVFAELFWGHQLHALPTPPDKDAQDLGLSFLVNVQVF
jgi:hemolysin activation/secretion protein